MRSLKTSYLLLLPSIFGVAGLHRFYMGKVWTGILWLCTMGLGGLGTIYDAITLAKQLARKDAEETGVYVDPGEYWLDLVDPMPEEAGFRRRVESRYGSRTAQPAETLELICLRLARDNGGCVSPAQLALDAKVGAEQAKTELERLVQAGMAELRIRKTGILVYVFPEFLSREQAEDLEAW